MGIDIRSLPLPAQQQILAKLGASKKAGNQTQPKYRNQKETRIMGKTPFKFDSKREAERFDVLYLLYTSGVIQDLRLQQNFTLVEGYTKPNGERVWPMVYKADFVYVKDGKRIVEDAKGVRTDKYKIKKKLMLDKLGIEILEV